MNTLKRQAPEVKKKKKKSLEIVTCWSKDARDKKKKKPFTIVTLTTVVV